MKFFLLLAVYFFYSSVIFAQRNNRTPDVIISIKGNKNLFLKVDAKNYNLSGNNVSNNVSTLTVTDLQPGKHTLDVVRTHPRINRQDNLAIEFNLRYRFDMYITLNPNGSIELIEKRKNQNVANKQQPMNDVAFRNLTTTIKNQRTPDNKYAQEAAAFNNTSNFFTTAQVYQLLQLIIGNNSRLALAKLSYRGVTDPDNFNKVNNLLSSQASIADLEDYVDNYEDAEDTDTGVNSPMTDASFNTIYQNIKNQRPVNTQINSISNIFTNTDNIYSSYQASQLIQLINNENSRLMLAKLSYRGIADPANINLIYNLLTYQSRDELTAYIETYNQNGQVKVIMTDAAFNSLYNNIKNQRSVSTQVNLMTNAFSTADNYFSSNQASRLIQLINDESNRLMLAKLSYLSIVDHENISQVSNLLGYQSRNDFMAYIENYNKTSLKVPMTDANFTALYQNIKGQWSGTTQLNLITNAFNQQDNYFTSYQASQLIQLSNAENTRLQLAKISYRSITDPANFNQVFNLLSYQASKDDLTNFIKNYSSGTTNRVAMTDENFNSLYQSLEIQFLPGSQMFSLTDLFNNTTEFFTTAQVKKLILLVSNESNRLQLAKSAYRTVTDRGNYSQLYDILNSQSSRNDLDSYVKAYKD